MNLDEIRELITLMKENQIAEIDLEHEGERLRVVSALVPATGDLGLVNAAGQQPARIPPPATEVPELVPEVEAAADRTGERVWPLPLWEEYSEDIKSKVADIKNMGTGRLSGTVAGAVFLKEFIGETPWVHLDIAGTAWQDKDQPYIPSGGSGIGVRLITDLLLKRVGG